MPLVLGTTGAAVRVRVNRRLVTWGGKPPRVEQKLYLPLRYLPQLERVIATRFRGEIRRVAGRRHVDCRRER